MRTSGVASERSLTVVVLLLALALLVILAGGPFEFMYTVQRAIHSMASIIVQFVQQLRA
jgi:hypothetical protein